MKAQMKTVDINEILKYLPHRYPFLLIDRVLELELDKRILALKNVTFNEPFFTGHFPHLPVMPGVLVLEAMAQAAGILSFATMGRRSDDESVFYFAGIDERALQAAGGAGRPAEAGGRHPAQVAHAVEVQGYRHRRRAGGRGGELMCALREIEGRGDAMAADTTVI